MDQINTTVPLTEQSVSSHHQHSYNVDSQLDVHNTQHITPVHVHVYA